MGTGVGSMKGVDALVGAAATSVGSGAGPADKNSWVDEVQSYAKNNDEYDGPEDLGTE